MSRAPNGHAAAALGTAALPGRSLSAHVAVCKLYMLACASPVVSGAECEP